MSEPIPPPFDALPAAARRTLDLTKGQNLFRQGDPADQVYYIARGGIDMLRVTETGAPVLIHRGTAGNFIAEASLFAPEYHCDAVAIAETKVVAMAKPAIERAMASDPGFAPQLLAFLARQVQGLRQKVTLLAIKCAEDRIAAALASGIPIRSVPSFAAEIGLSPEATYRALTRATKAGRLVKTGRGRYRLAP